jgi:threonine/homoserine/homoserine lactone efflux protein
LEFGGPPGQADDMGSVIGELLPLAIGVAISPIPIIAVILMLLTKRARGNSTGFLVGWVAGIVLVTTVILVVVGQAANTSTGPSTLSSVLKLVFGVLLLSLAAKQWRERPEPGQSGVMPKWMDAIESFTPIKALGLGFALSAINPKNLLLCLAAGTTIGAGHLSAGGEVVAVVIFTLLASITVSGPVVGYLTEKDRMNKPLTELRVWLTQNNATVMAVLLLVIGVVLIGKSIAGFSS